MMRTRRRVAILAVLFLTVATTAVWLVRVPAVVGDLPELLLVIGGFAVFFGAHQPGLPLRITVAVGIVN